MYIIYTIQNKVSNGIYVGQTMNFNRRKGAHFGDLAKNRHANEHLQRSFNKNGKEAFDMVEIETHETAHAVNEAEDFFISYLKFLGAKIYNQRLDSSRVGLSELGCRGNRGRKQSLEERLQRSTSLKEVHRKAKESGIRIHPATLSEEHRANLSIAARKAWSQDTDRKEAAAKMLRGQKYTLGRPPWNKGRTGVYTEETIEKFRRKGGNWSRGRKNIYSPEILAKMSEGRRLAWARKKAAQAQLSAK